MNGRVVSICVCSLAGEKMHHVQEVEAIAGAGLKGDRYCIGEGSFNKGKQGKRQVTLINGLFFENSGFTFAESRRNIITRDVELMWLIGKEFQVGTARLRGLKYCDPCERPSKLSGQEGFKESFFDRGGLVAEVIEGGIIRVGDTIILPPKGY